MRYAKYLTERLQSIARNRRAGGDSNHDFCPKSDRQEARLVHVGFKAPSERLLSFVEIVYICETLTGIELGEPFLGSAR